MKKPLVVGRILYFFGYPILWKMLHNTTRAYVLVVVGSEVLVTKNFLGFHKIWRLPGGGLKKGEDRKLAVIRELAEEVGITTEVDCLQLLNAKPLKAPTFGYDYYLYVLKLSKKPIITVDKHEIANAEFLDVKSPNLPELSDEAHNAIKLAKIG